MKLSRNLKKQVEQAESKEEKRKLIEAAGMKLTDDELGMVAGGMNIDDDGDNTKCSDSNAINNQHDWIIGANGKLTCRFCGVYMY